jgi:hypothetical protein
MTLTYKKKNPQLPKSTVSLSKISNSMFKTTTMALRLAATLMMTTATASRCQGVRQERRVTSGRGWGLSANPQEVARTISSQHATTNRHSWRCINSRNFIFPEHRRQQWIELTRLIVPETIEQHWLICRFLTSLFLANFPSSGTNHA